MEANWGRAGSRVNRVGVNGHRDWCRWSSHHRPPSDQHRALGSLSLLHPERELLPPTDARTTLVSMTWSAGCSPRLGIRNKSTSCSERKVLLKQFVDREVAAEREPMSLS